MSVIDTTLKKFEEVMDLKIINYKYIYVVLKGSRSMKMNRLYKHLGVTDEI